MLSASGKCRTEMVSMAYFFIENHSPACVARMTVDPRVLRIPFSPSSLSIMKFSVFASMALRTSSKIITSRLAYTALAKA
jgi:hypothetical protein